MSELAVDNMFHSSYWAPELSTIQLPGSQETILTGDERDFTRLQYPFHNIGELLVVGYTSQGPSQAMNIRDSLAAGGVNTKVRVGLREGSESWDNAIKDGFTEGNGGLLVINEENMRRADMVLFLMSDAGLAEDGRKYLKWMHKGAAAGYSHGYFKGFMNNRGYKFREDLTYVGVCPKGLGPSLRDEYLVGHGINASAVWAEGDQDGMDLALGWSYALGAPTTFKTTFDMERKSDLVGERAILLGAVHAIVEASYAHKRLEEGMDPDQAYLTSVETLVRGITQTISEKGLRGVYESLSETDKEEFVRVYNASYPGFRSIIEKIYRDVESGREVEEVYQDGKNNTPMSNVAGTEMWQVAAKFRANNQDMLANYKDIDATVAALYVAGMMAQVDVLKGKGHYWSEIGNESIIEAIDSLNKQMLMKGIDYMVDRCSITARRGTRKWGPLFQAWIMQEVYPNLAARKEPAGSGAFGNFLGHDVHAAFDTLSELRPSKRYASN